MKFIREQERKFVDMGNVKNHQMIFPVVYPAEGGHWGPVVRFDNKTLVPGGQDIQNFAGSPLQVVRVMISGTATYFDTAGNRVVMHSGDALMVNAGKGALQATLHNTDEKQEDDLLEIWLNMPVPESMFHFQLASIQREEGWLYPLGFSEGLTIQLWRGIFGSGSSYTLQPSSDIRYVVIFLLEGGLTINGRALAYRDTVVLKADAPLEMNFDITSEIFLMRYS
ncbi:hypothetical protein FPZ43_18395 [Mucilaginibacter pallidiroseus]|uniref:Pirin N-terminal domain-containing protein n=1 Tax=Mucilaginibacter pallidiroseus TaxID=2599295 RepID=A0A563TYF4_9SPHI|nr:pirin family protein [Mucilaginibacter pallidiroseus]TWR24397.1 hypothetical protein FPZ43_18395 [Mucilaginibacter pallidiroseus]